MRDDRERNSNSLHLGVDFSAVMSRYHMRLAGMGVFGGMDARRIVRRQLKSAIAPMVFLSLTAYFGWHAWQGDRGLESFPDRQRELQQARMMRQNALDEAKLWQRRVNALRGMPQLDLDALEERARAMLNVSDPNDVVVLYPGGQRLF